MIKVPNLNSAASGAENRPARVRRDGRGGDVRHLHIHQLCFPTLVGLLEEREAALLGRREESSFVVRVERNRGNAALRSGQSDTRRVDCSNISSFEARATFARPDVDLLVSIS